MALIPSHVAHLRFLKWDFFDRTSLTPTTRDITQRNHFFDCFDYQFSIVSFHRGIPSRAQWQLIDTLGLSMTLVVMAIGVTMFMHV